MSPAGSKIISYPPLWRRAEQTGIIQRNFPARWLALLLMGSVGAAWALSPGNGNSGRPPRLEPTTKTVLEGDPQAVSQLLGSLVGESALPAEAQKTLAPGAARRIVLESRADDLDPMASQREKAHFLRTVEEVEAQYMATGKYPAAPAAAQGAVMTYQTDGEQFTLKAGSRWYSASEGLSFGAPPASAAQFEVKGYLSAQTGGWGPWKRDFVAFEPKAGEQSAEGLEFLKELPLGQPGSARMFFPIDRKTCGYLFRRTDGTSIYHSGELTYDAVTGGFSLKLFRAAEVANHNLDASALEQELENRDNPVVMVGEGPYLADLGLASPGHSGEEVVVLSGGAALPCSAAGALDGLRLATLNRRKEALPAVRFARGGDASPAGQASAVGRMQVTDKLGQVHHLRLRGGRGANYDWVIGQLCPEENETPVTGFVDSQAMDCEDAVRPEERLVKAGR